MPVQWKKKGVALLRVELDRQGLDKAGVKGVLVGRLEQADTDAATAAGNAAADVDAHLPVPATAAEALGVGGRVYTNLQLWLGQVIYAPKVHTADVESCFNIIDEKCPGHPTMDHVSLTCITHFGQLEQWAAKLPPGSITKKLVTTTATARKARRKTEQQLVNQRLLQHNVACSKQKETARMEAYIAQLEAEAPRKRQSLRNVPSDLRSKCEYCGREYCLPSSLRYHQKGGGCPWADKARHPALYDRLFFEK
jgi:hypothetical protein